MILVWSLKKLICMVPLVRCITTARDVRNQVLSAGIRESWSSSRTWTHRIKFCIAKVQLLSHLHVGPRLEQVLSHVVLEVVEQLHLLLHGGGELVHGVVMLRNKYQEKSRR